MFIKPKNSKKRLQNLASQILNMLSKNLYIDGQYVTALRSQLTRDPVQVLAQLGDILQQQRIETIKDFGTEIEIK